MGCNVSSETREIIHVQEENKILQPVETNKTEEKLEQTR